MNFKKCTQLECKTSGVSGCFAAYGSFGRVDGGNELDQLRETATGYEWASAECVIRCDYETLENGVCHRQDYVTNPSDQPLTLTHYVSRFVLEGGEYEVYSQFSSWQHESEGKWQDLSTGVEIATMGIRMTDGATPMVALRNKGNGKIFVFHLLPNALWKISVDKRPLYSKCDGIVVEMGLNPRDLRLQIAPGETLAMPEIFCFEAKNKLDLDAWKIHRIYNRLYPRKQLPILYNTWLLDFDNVDVENILQQAKCAAELGVEYFILDAGWFGSKKNWDECIGDWVENLQGGYFGRVREVSEKVRAMGLKFGMWLEPERALAGVENVALHPEYYLEGSGDNRFLNFANPEAWEYIFNVTCNLIETYHLSYMKFDFNANLAYDPSGNGFYRYFAGQEKYVRALKEKYPGLYLTNCASGGARMDMGQHRLFDSVWLSDNQGPYEGLRIVKDTALRLSTCAVERWDVRRFVEDFPAYHQPRKPLPISCNNATWDFVLNVDKSYTHAFLTGGPIGFSCDIAGYPAEEKACLKQFLDEYKAQRDFYKKAELRVLHDRPNLLVLQYSDPEAEQIVVQVFTKVTYQNQVTVYPVLPDGGKYRANDDCFCAKELKEEGILFDDLKDNSCQTLILKKA